VSRRVVLLIAALLVAALGTALVFVYVNGADDRALEDKQPVSILVAKNQIASGTTIDDAQTSGSIELRDMPKDSVVTGALSSTEPIAGQVALTTIYPGQQILTTLFGATVADQAASDLAIPPGNIAVSMQFGDPARVAGFVQPGSHVAVFVTASEDTAGDTGSGSGNDFIRVLLPNALVIAVGPTTITPPQDPTQANQEALPRALLTLGLSQRDSQKLIYASTKGSLYLGLLNSKSKIDRGTVVSLNNLFK
jgi:pilus assembly protein CpaB